MIVGGVADLHFTGKRWEEQSRLLRRCLDAMRSEGVEAVICAGDIVDNPKLLDRWAYPSTLAQAILDPVREAGLPWYVSAGNHDETPSDQSPALAFLSACPLMHIAARGVEAHSLADDTSLVLLPWQSKSDWAAGRKGDSNDAAWKDHCKSLLRSSVKSLFAKDAKFKILAAHLEVEGSVATPYKILVPGSSFVVRSEDVWASGADLVMLGHIHQRQGPYLGALWQNNYGEAGNPDGWLWANTKTGESRYVPLDAPKFWVVQADQYREADYRPCDQVRIIAGRGTAQALSQKALGDNVEIRVLPESFKVTERVTGLSPFTDPAVLLGVWMDRNMEDPDFSLFEGLQTLMATVDLPDTSIEGALEWVDRIAVHGVGPHRHVDVNLRNSRRWRVIGGNGSGKTFFIESIIACFYGDWAHPKRPSLRDTVTLDDAWILVEFWSGGTRYRAQRKFLNKGGKFHHEAYLWSMAENGDLTALAGRKVQEFEAAIKNVVGPKEMFLSGAFASQDRAEDIIVADPAERMEFMRKVLGIQWCDVISAAAAERAKPLRQWLDQHEDPAATRPQIKKALAEALRHEEAIHGEMDEARRRQAEIQHALEEVQGRIQDAVERRGALMGADKRYRGLLDMKEHLQETLRRIHLQMENLEKKAFEIPDIASRLAQAREAGEQLKALETSLAEQKAVDAQIQAMTQEKRQIQETLARDLAEARREIEQIQARVGEMEDRVGNLEEVGCRKIGFLPCPYINEALQDRDSLPGLKDTLRSLQQAFKARQQENPETHPRIQEISEALQAQRGKLGKACDPILLQSLRRKAGYVPDLTADLREAEGSPQALKSLQEQQGEESAKILQLDMEIEETNQEVISRLRIDREIELLRQELEQVRTRMRPVEQELHALSLRLGAAQNQVEEAETRLSALDQFESQYADRVEDARKWETLREAFGRSGIPQLVISSSIGPLQDIIDDICQKDYEGDFVVRLDTQRETRKGSAQERFMLWFHQGGDEPFDASSASGGQAQAIRQIWHLAIVLYCSALTRYRYHVLFMDEVTANQDSLMVEKGIGMLNRLEQKFNQMFTVSHTDSVLVDIPATIRFG